MPLTKNYKTNMRQGLSGFVKTGKVNKNKNTSYLAKITKYQRV